jgi:hypothetical protein
LNKDVNFIRESYPTPTDTGVPYYYALFGPQYTLTNELSFIVGPTPDDSYAVELHYFYYPESIVTTQSTTVVAVVCGKKATFGRTTNCYKVPGVGKLNLYHSQLKGSRVGDQKTLTLQFRKSAFLPGVQYIQTK